MNEISSIRLFARIVILSGIFLCAPPIQAQARVIELTYAGEPRRYGRVPALGEHTASIRAEFMP